MMLYSNGVKISAKMSAGATAAELKKTLQAALNRRTYPYDRGKRVARKKCIKIMHKRFDIPYVNDIMPIRFKNSFAWLAKSHSLCKALSRQS